jgi:hypothetical protein
VFKLLRATWWVLIKWLPDLIDDVCCPSVTVASPVFYPNNEKVGERRIKEGAMSRFARCASTPAVGAVTLTSHKSF